MTETKLVKTPLDELTYQIVGCAMAIHRKLGPGYCEDTYQRNLQAYLAEKNIPYPSAQIPVQRCRAMGFHGVVPKTSETTRFALSRTSQCPSSLLLRTVPHTPPALLCRVTCAPCIAQSADL